MSTNCLVTKLKASVDNNSLVKIGEFIWHLNLSERKKVKVSWSSNASLENGHLEILGENNLYFTSDADGTQNQSKTAFNSYVYFPVGEYDVLVTNKYGIITLEECYGLNLDNLKYSEELYFLSASNATGSIESVLNKPIKYGLSISKSPTLYGSISGWGDKNCEIRITYCPNVTGELTSLASIDSTNLISIVQTKISGSIEDFVAALVAKNNASYLGKRELRLSESLVTIGGVVRSIPDQLCNLVVTDATHWHYLGNSDENIANPTIPCTIYAKGATAEEIAAWEANNNTVVKL